jgi:hypothetical protein
MPGDLFGASLAKPVIDALMRALGRAHEAHLQRNARKALSEAITELIRVRPDLNHAEAQIAVARAAGIIDRDLFTAERMLRKVRKADKRERDRKSRKKPAARRKRPAARERSKR